ncbi:MAG: chitobiase/beta-hexosaminidase C-terminal domain-containing protein [Defluviitaleaceae bacterium]|nr:chitobiase/beta-hexosaminidase C-terminal domain-containing protein [Defluviitaleaceae bacterium]
MLKNVQRKVLISLMATVLIGGLVSATTVHAESELANYQVEPTIGKIALLENSIHPSSLEEPLQNMVIEISGLSIYEMRVPGISLVEDDLEEDIYDMYYDGTYQDIGDGFIGIAPLSTSSVSFPVGAVFRVNTQSTTNNALLVFPNATTNTAMGQIHNGAQVTIRTGTVTNGRIEVTVTGGTTAQQNTWGGRHLWVSTAWLELRNRAPIGTGVTVTVSPTSAVFTGSAITPTVTVRHSGRTLVRDRDFSLSFSNNVNVGTATITIRGLNNFSGTITRTFSITRANLSTVSNVTVTLSPTSAVFTGRPIEPTVTIRHGSRNLVRDRDFRLAFSNNTNVGTATVTITGIGNYSGTITRTFTITPANIANVTVTLTPNSFVYTGYEQRPTVIIRHNNMILVEGRDYRLSFYENINVGIATVRITGMGNFAGTITMPFPITPGEPDPIPTSRPFSSLPSGTYPSGTQFTLNHVNPNARIYFTLDGSIPDRNSTLYTQPITINRAMTVKTVAYVEGYLLSEVAVYEYTVLVNPPRLSLTGDGPFPIGFQFAILHDHPDAVIHFTLDGTTPTRNSTIFTSPIILNEDMTVRAIAYIAGFGISEVMIRDLRVMSIELPGRIFELEMDGTEGIVNNTNNTITFFISELIYTGRLLGYITNLDADADEVIFIVRNDPTEYVRGEGDLAGFSTGDVVFVRGGVRYELIIKTYREMPTPETGFIYSMSISGFVGIINKDDPTNATITFNIPNHILNNGRLDGSITELRAEQDIIYFVVNGFGATEWPGRLGDWVGFADGDIVFVANGVRYTIRINSIFAEALSAYAFDEESNEVEEFLADVLTYNLDEIIEEPIER